MFWCWSQYCFYVAVFAVLNYWSSQHNMWNDIYSWWCKRSKNENLIADSAWYVILWLMMFLSFRPAGETKFSVAKSHQLLKYVAPIDCSHPLLTSVAHYHWSRYEISPIIEMTKWILFVFLLVLFHFIVSFRPTGETKFSAAKSHQLLKYVAQIRCSNTLLQYRFFCHFDQREKRSSAQLNHISCSSMLLQ